MGLFTYLFGGSSGNSLFAELGKLRPEEFPVTVCYDGRYYRVTDATPEERALVEGIREREEKGA